MYFKKYYYPPVNFHSVWFSEMVLKYLHINGKKIEKNDVVLDVGCGLGNHCFCLQSYKPEHIYGFDISRETIELLNTFTDSIFFKNVDICKDDITRMLDKFTVIFSSDVYEHVEDPQIMLNNLYRMLKKGGAVCVTFPNLDDHGHNQFTELSEFTERLQKAGFTHHKVTIVDGLSLPYIVFTKIYKVFQKISDKMYGIKRSANQMPESDEFHEMYAYKKINKIKNRTFLVRFINFSYDIMKRLCRFSSIYRVSSPANGIRNKRILFFAVK